MKLCSRLTVSAVDFCLLPSRKPSLNGVQGLTSGHLVLCLSVKRCRCGNQIGAKFWEVIADEHGIDPTGQRGSFERSEAPKNAGKLREGMGL